MTPQPQTFGRNAARNCARWRDLLIPLIKRAADTVGSYTESGMPVLNATPSIPS